jgi:hypothetical protein
MLNAARTLGDLRSPPGNRLESLRGDHSGLHGIRVKLTTSGGSSSVGKDPMLTTFG